MADIVIGGLGNRWCAAGLVWEREQKGAWINLLTFTLDLSYGKFGAPMAGWELTFRHMRKSEKGQPAI